MTNKKGFTLIELLIVITIIGVLAVALLPRIAGIPAKGRDTSRITAMNGLVQALQSFYSDNGQYPAAASGACLKAGQSYTDPDVERLKTYVDGDFPSDPQGGNKVNVRNALACTGGYYYKPILLNSSANQAYMLVANTEGDGSTEFYIDGTTLPATTSTTAKLGDFNGTPPTVDKAKGKNPFPSGDNNVYVIAR